MAENKPKSKAELMAEKMAKQRVGEKAFEAGKKPIVETNPPIETAQEAEISAQEPPKEEKAITTPPEEEKAVVAAESDEASIADAYEKELKKQNKKDSNKVHMSLTLSPEVKAELQKRAKRAGKTASAYLDGLLKEKVFKL